MTVLAAVFLGLFVLSAGWALFLAFRLYVKTVQSSDLTKELEAAKGQITSLKKNPTYDAEQLLHDLTAGDAIVRIQRLGPLDYMIRSPKG